MNYDRNLLESPGTRTYCIKSLRLKNISLFSLIQLNLATAQTLEIPKYLKSVFFFTVLNILFLSYKKITKTHFQVIEQFQMYIFFSTIFFDAWFVSKLNLTHNNIKNNNNNNKKLRLFT